MPISPLHYYSRSAVTTDWRCPRQRYLQYHAAGPNGPRGWQPDDLALELYMGIVVHDALAGIAHGLDIDQLASTAQQEFYNSLLGHDQGATDYASEQAALVEGLIRGFHRQVWPKLTETYPTIVHIEKEFLIRHDAEGSLCDDGEYGFMSKPDLLLRNKDGQLVYVEYKTTGSVKDSWFASWQTAIQLHSSVLAVERCMGEEVAEIIVQGLYKGYYSQYNRQESPFCYGYLTPGTPPFTKDTWSLDWRRGATKSPIWLREGGVKKWVSEMPAAALGELFPQVPPIVINRDLAMKFFRQQAHREDQIHYALQELEHGGRSPVDEIFPQHWEQCSPSFGKPCGYKMVCHGNVVDLAAAGYTPRTSHHQIEEDHLKEQVDA